MKSLAVPCEVEPDAHAMANLFGKPEIVSRDYRELEQPGVQIHDQTHRVVFT